MLFHHAHRTALKYPPSSDVSLSPTDSLSQNPTQGGFTDGFV